MNLSTDEAAQLHLDLAVRRPNARAQIRELLRDGRWHTGAELMKVGGRRYGARLLEIRVGSGAWPAWNVETRRCALQPGEYEYRATFTRAALR